MGLLFKVLGLIIIFLVCLAFGYRKSYYIRKRANLLSVIYRSLTLLAEYIKAENGEISKLLPICFGENFVSTKDNKIIFKKDFFEKADIELLTEFFERLGYSDKNSEYERTKLFISLVKSQWDEAELKAKSLCRLYNTIGLLTGVFLMIFFL